MDQIKIGRFIAECRKQTNLTQAHLAEKLGITDKAVSKWERGISMPDSSIMLELCDILGISVNELLSGEKLTMENSDKKNEQLLLDMAKELAEKNKTIITSMWVHIIISTLALLVGVFFVLALIPEGTVQTVIVVGLVMLFLIPCLYAVKLEVSAGAYKCKNCGCEFVPTYSEVIWSVHMGTTRRLKCPECNKCAWCKKVLK